MTKLNTAYATLETAPTRYVEGNGVRFAYRQLGPSVGAGALHPIASTPSRAIKQPTLVVSGSDDTMLPSENAYAIFKAMSNAYFMLYPDSDHGALFQHHDAFVSHVRTFLNA